MNNEISEQAKKSLANAARQAASRRLERDGAHSSDALRRRVRAFAQERDIPPADYAKLVHKRVNDRAIHVFCEKYKVSYDWLLCGDLRGLQRMAQNAFADRPEISEAERKEVVSLYCALSPRMQTAALGCLRELMTRGLSNG